MNVHALLALLGDLYAQLTQAQATIADLEAKLASRPASPDDEKPSR